MSHQGSKTKMAFSGRVKGAITGRESLSQQAVMYLQLLTKNGMDAVLQGEAAINNREGNSMPIQRGLGLFSVQLTKQCLATLAP